MEVIDTKKLENISEFATIIENGEQKIIDAVKNNKAVYVERVNGEIVFIEEYDSEKEFVENYVKTQIEEGYDLYVFKTAEEVYLLNCNIAVSDYFSENEDLWDDTEGLKGEVLSNVNFRQALKTYEEITKDIKQEDFVDGFYEWSNLLFPYVAGENFSYDSTSNYYNESEQTLYEHTRTMQLFVK
jgi:hypothetical protein